MISRYSEGSPGQWYLIEGRITRQIKFEATRYVVSASSTITGLGEDRLPTMQIINHGVQKLADAVMVADEMYEQLVAWCRDVVGNYDGTPGYEPAETPIFPVPRKQLSKDVIPF